MQIRQKTAGVTLLEILLVMVIASAILVMFIGYMQNRTDDIRRTRAALQMQQILNAGLAYYVSTGNWPTMANLTDPTNPYLPANLNNPWGQSYNVGTTSSTNLFFVYSNVRSNANAQIVAGRLPLAYVTSATPPTITACGTGTTTCNAVASVTIPGQNLNNATAVTFAGIYHSGACVPVPSCPTDPRTGKTMTAQIYVVPASVAGVADAPSGCAWYPDSCTSNINIYPISAYTAFATGPSNQPAPCDSSSSSEICIYNSTGIHLPATDSQGNLITYWRACLSITTNKGVIKPSSTAWGMATGTILAITRCMPTYENTQDTTQPFATFEVWQQ